MPGSPKVVYFIQQGDTGPIKIGTTVLALLDSRLKQLQTSSPLPLRLLGVMEGGHNLERRFHERFASHRMAGEWFRAEHDLAQFVSLSARQPSEIQRGDSSELEEGRTAARNGEPPIAAHVPASRSLSPLESRLVLHLEAQKQMVVGLEEAMTILSCSYEHARQVLHRLARRGWLARITPGNYELIPAALGEDPFVETNPLFVGSTLV